MNRLKYASMTLDHISVFLITFNGDIVKRTRLYEDCMIFIRLDCTLVKIKMGLHKIILINMDVGCTNYTASLGCFKQCELSNTPNMVRFSFIMCCDS